MLGVLESFMMFPLLKMKMSSNNLIRCATYAPYHVSMRVSMELLRRFRQKRPHLFRTLDSMLVGSFEMGHSE